MRRGEGCLAWPLSVVKSAKYFTFNKTPLRLSNVPKFIELVM